MIVITLFVRRRRLWQIIFLVLRFVWQQYWHIELQYVRGGDKWRTIPIIPAALPSTLSLSVIVRQFGERNVEQIFFDLTNFQQENILVAIVGEHFIVNFRSNPKRVGKQNRNDTIYY